MGIYDSLLNVEPWVLILFIALIVNLISTLVYKYTTDQKKIKDLKKKQKELQKEVKKLQKHPEKAMKKQKEMMALSSTMMKQTLKPMLYTMLPLLLLFMWISSTLIFLPLSPGEPFTVTAEFVEGASGEVTLTSQPELNIQENTKTITEGKAIWTLTGDAGDYTLKLSALGFDYGKEIIITDQHKYTEPTEEFEGSLDKLTVGNKRVRPFGNFSLFGWKPGMIGAYIILSILFSFGMRRALKVA